MGKMKRMNGLKIREISIHVESRDRFEPYKWNELVASFPCASIFQTMWYLEFMKRNSFCKEKYLLAKNDNNEIIGLALAILTKKSKFYPNFAGKGEVRFGPLIRAGQDYEKVLSIMLDELDEICKEESYSSSIIFPPPKSPISHTFPKTRNDKELYCTYLLDLRRSEEEIFRDVSRSWRKNIKKGYKQLKLHFLKDPNDSLIQELYAVHLEKIERGKLRDLKTTAFPLRYFKDTIDIFVRRNVGYYVIGTYNGKVVSGVCTIGYGDYGVSWLSDSSRVHPKIKATHVLRWEGIKWSKSQGYKYYDFGQVSSNPQDPKKRGVYIFKRGFGGEYYEVHNRLKPYGAFGNYVLPMIKRFGRRFPVSQSI